MKWRAGLILGAVLVAYLLLGGLIFHFMESQPEQETSFKVANFTRDFLAEHPCLTRADLDALVETVLKAYDQGIRASNQSSAATTNWDYASSVFFSLTVITTIGYGHITPVTSGGRALCVVYALVGIPLTLYFLAGLGAGLHAVNKRWDRSMTGCRAHPKVGRWLRVTIIFMTGVVVLLLIPGAIFAVVDHWTFAEAMYCVFITLTTIGFGDFVPDGAYIKSPGLRSFYRLFTTVIIFCGLAWISSIISHMQEWFSKVGEKTEQEMQKLQTKNNNGSENKAMDTSSLDKTTTLEASLDKDVPDEQYLP